MYKSNFKIKQTGIFWRLWALNKSKVKESVKFKIVMQSFFGLHIKNLYLTNK